MSRNKKTKKHLNGRYIWKADRAELEKFKQVLRDRAVMSTAAWLRKHAEYLGVTPEELKALPWG